MTTAINRTGIKLISDPNVQRAALVPFAVGIGLGWVFIVIWGVVACVAFLKSPLWGALLLASLAAFASLLGFLSYTIVRNSCRDYIFEITDTDAVLLVIDRLRRRRSMQMVLLEDIKFAEYYPYRDSASIIFHAPYTKMEVPLWPMGSRGQDVVDFLLGRGVRVVNVQSDDNFPE
jgi:hypothetical protein